MSVVPELRTGRLVLRAWRPDDLAPFAALNADARVAEFLGGPLSRAESDAMAGRIALHFAAHGFGLWAVEVPGVADFVGFVGLSVPGFAAPFTPCVEVGWRLDPARWGRGYATEAARAAVAFGFERLGLAGIVSFTVPANARSRAVMERLGMRRDPADDFDHPRLPEGHPLRRHVLYRLPRAAWASAARPAERSLEARALPADALDESRFDIDRAPPLARSTANESAGAPLVEQPAAGDPGQGTASGRSASERLGPA